jgi:RecG-like helicase
MGLKLQEKDMQLRGPGELLGQRQAGFMQFKVADIERDADILEDVAHCAEAMLQKQPELVEPLVHRWVSNSVEYAQV